MTVINTNARSLCPKISSLIDCFTDLTAEVGVVTETGLTDGDSLDKEVEDLMLGTELQMIYRNREANTRGFSHGGVAIIYKEALLNMRQVKIHNPKKFEVLLTQGTIKGSARKIVVIACYAPPN